MDVRSAQPFLDELGYGCSVDGFLLQQCCGNEIESATMFGQRDACSFFLFAQNSRNLVVDLLGGVVAVFATRRHEIFAEEHLLLSRPCHRSNGVTHAPFPNHSTGDGGGLFEVVGCTAVETPEHDGLCYATTHRLANHVLEVLARVRVSFFGQAPCDAEGHAAGEDGDLVERVAVGQHRGEHCVTAFVVGNGALLLCIEGQAFTSRTHHHSVTSILEVDSFDVGGTAPHGDECRLVHQVAEVGTAHSGCGLGGGFEVDIGAHLLPGGVHLQNRQAFLGLGQWDDDLSVEASRT